MTNLSQAISRLDITSIILGIACLVIGLVGLIGR